MKKKYKKRSEVKALTPKTMVLALGLTIKKNELLSVDSAISVDEKMSGFSWCLRAFVRETTKIFSLTPGTEARGEPRRGNFF